MQTFKFRLFTVTSIVNCAALQSLINFGPLFGKQHTRASTISSFMLDNDEGSVIYTVHVPLVASHSAV